MSSVPGTIQSVTDTRASLSLSWYQNILNVKFGSECEPKAMPDAIRS